MNLSDNAIIAAMVTKVSPKKAGAWLAQLTQPRGEDGRGRAKTKGDERADVPAGVSFRFEVLPGRGEVAMGTRIPVTTRGVQFSIPPSLFRQLHEATNGRNWTTALVALADYAMDRLDEEPVAVTFLPDQDPDGDGAVICRWKKEPARRVRLSIDGTLPGFAGKGRRKIAMPEDVRVRIEKAMDHQRGFSGMVTALAQYALTDLKKRKSSLVVLPAS